MSFSPTLLRKVSRNLARRSIPPYKTYRARTGGKNSFGCTSHREHCDHPDSGCPVAALAPEMARAKLGVRKRISGLIKDRAERWMEFMPGRTAAEREQNFSVIFSAMAGAVSIARILTDPGDRQKVLADMRDHLLRSF